MPIVISDSLVLALADTPIPATHPRILYDDIFGQGGGTLTASSEAAGFSKENAVDYFTYDFWQATSLPATLEVELDEARPVDYILIAAHQLGTMGAAAQGQYHDGSGWVDLTIETAPGTDDVLAFLFEEVTTSRVRIRITGDGDCPSIGVVMAGKALAMERGVSLDHAPITMSRKTTFSPADSEEGQWLGRSIRRNAAMTTLKFNLLTEGFVRGEVDPFIASARSYPFGWLWSPVSFPLDAAYVRCDVDIVPKYADLQDRMNVEFPVTGLVA